MVWVPAGGFLRGSQFGVEDEQPQRSIYLDGYWIYKYEVTVAQYRAFCYATRRSLPPCPSDYSWSGKTGWDDAAMQQHPIVNVTWDDAKAYADWAGVTLPTEAQWEKAARGTDGRNYPWGGMATPADPNNGWDQTKCANGYTSNNVGKSTWPVGSFPADTSPYGAMDMAGNVAELCSDWYNSNYYSSAPSSNPPGPSGVYPYRTLRGGTWYYWDNSIPRCANRDDWSLDEWNYNDIGFRCVAVSPGPAPTISNFTPSSGGTGTMVTLTGTNFIGASAVAFGGTAVASFTVTNATTISATIGNGATGTITVTTPGGTATSNGAFTFIPAPVITSFTPSGGGAGTVVTLTGTSFTGASAVAFGGIAAASFTVVSNTSITATVGIGATGTITVTTLGGMATSATSFTMYSADTPGTNTADGAAMVWVPRGSFTMGTPYNAWWNTPYTQQVTLSGYWIYKYQVTVAQYLAFLSANPTYISPDSHSHLPPWPGNQYSWAGKSSWTDSAVQQFPIVNVSWNDCEAYATWAGVSLPTEAQYEYASRGPLENNYPWGGTATATDPNNGWDQTKCANSYNSYAVGISTWPVDSFPASASWCGAQDLAGNVWEWCQDWYGDYSSTPVTNPTGPLSGSYRVLRGGSWCYYFNSDGGDEIDYRGAYRYDNNPTYWGNDVGFRCVAASPGP